MFRYIYKHLIVKYHDRWVELKKIKGIFIFLILFSGLIFGFATTPVIAVSIYSLDYGWENQNTGSQNYTDLGASMSGLIEYEMLDTEWGDTFHVEDTRNHSGSKSFWTKWDDGDHDALGWWNITTNFDYISTISIWYNVDTMTGSGATELEFYDDDVLALEISFNDLDIDFYDYTTGWIEIESAISMDNWYELRITHVSGNTMNYSIFNATGVLEHTVIDTSAEQDTWDTFDSVLINNPSGVPGNTNQIYFDDFNITTSAGASGWETCQGGTFLVTKLFYNSIGYYNDTLSFTIQKNLLATGYYAIYNSTGSSPIQSSTFNSQTFPTWYFVDPQYGTGTYYMKVGYDFGTWLMSCPFTIITSTASVTDWSVRFEKSSYSEGEWISLFYKIPVGETGNISIILNDEYLYRNYLLLSGTGTEVKMTNLFKVMNSWNGHCLNAWLRNSTNDFLMGDNCHSVACFSPDIDYWTLYVDDGFTASINYGESVRINGDHNYGDAWVRFMNDTDPVNGTILSQYDVGVDSFWFNYDKFPNTTVGVERFYIYLYADNNYLIDDIIRYIDVYDEDVLTPFTDEGWYGLPFWLPYLIGIFITLFITMSPLIIGTYISRNTRMTKVSIPPLLYVGFFFFGLIVSVLMDFLPSWLPFVILFGMITFFAVQWLYGKKGEIAGE